MQTVCCMAGILLIVAVAILLLCWAWAVVSEKLEERREARRRRSLEEARKEWGQRILNDAHWLSENVDAYCTMETIGRALVGDYPDMWAFRNGLWNKIEKAKKERAPAQG